MESRPSDRFIWIGLLGRAGLRRTSLWLGQDLNFDLLAYHFYSGYALVQGPLDQDVGAAGWHTYINPLPDA